MGVWIPAYAGMTEKEPGNDDEDSCPARISNRRERAQVLAEQDKLRIGFKAPLDISKIDHKISANRATFKRMEMHIFHPGRRFTG